MALKLDDQEREEIKASLLELFRRNAEYGKYIGQDGMASERQQAYAQASQAASQAADVLLKHFT